MRGKKCGPTIEVCSTGGTNFYCDPIYATPFMLMLNLIADISQVTYPLLVVDIASSRLPKRFDTESIESLEALAKPIEIFEAATLLVDDPGSYPEESCVEVFRLDSDDASRGQFVDRLVDVSHRGCVVSHNAVSDMKLIKLLLHRFGICMPPVEKVFCTMRYGVIYSTVHVYRGGKKIKKFPHLQALLSELLGERVCKGDILDDVLQCFACFKLMEMKASPL